MAPSLHPRGIPGMPAVVPVLYNPVIGWHPIDRQHHSFGNDTLQARAPPSLGDHENLQGALLEPGKQFFFPVVRQRKRCKDQVRRAARFENATRTSIRNAFCAEPFTGNHSTKLVTITPHADDRGGFPGLPLRRPLKKKDDRKDDKKDKEQRPKAPGPQPTLNVSAPSPPHIRYPISYIVHHYHYHTSTCTL